MDDSDPEEESPSSSSDGDEEMPQAEPNSEDLGDAELQQGYIAVPAPDTVKELTIIECPADVQNETKAYEMLGGLHNIADIAADHDITMRFNMCSPYKFTPPVEGQRKLTAKAVFRVDEDGTVELVGVATVTYVFDLLADFHYLAPKSLNYGETATPGELQLGREISSLSAFPEMLYCPPPYFTKKLLPDNYDFDDNAYAPILGRKMERDGEDFDINRPLPKKVRVPTAHVPCHVVRTYDTAIPNAPPEGLRACEEKWELQCLEQVRQLFNERPVWLRVSLEAHLPDETKILSWMFNRVLQHVSYLWQDGPFRQCYVRLGYDPRKHSESMQYQVIDFRDPDLRIQKIKGKQRKSKDAPKKTQKDRLAEVEFRKPPIQQSQLYQLVDIQDVAIQELIANFKLNEKFDNLQGYMSTEFFTKIRNGMKVKSAMMRSLNKNSSLALTGGSASWAT
eukprot:GEMP01042360.1.p1 GENE.GEMP01042360.1~~GEMP01042360.1.p1  ORF type:complete len:461 (-),score=87.77 GEMP01042360.1:464-1816(-)